MKVVKVERLDVNFAVQLISQATIWELPKSGTLILSPNRRALKLLQGHPQKGPPLYGNSHVPV